MVGTSAAAGIAGCSPGIYKAEADAFAKAATMANDSLRQSAVSAGQAALQTAIGDGVTGGGSFETSPACDDLVSASTEFVAKTGDDSPILTAEEAAEIRRLTAGLSGCTVRLVSGERTQDLLASVSTPATLVLFEEITNYARLLAELAGAEDLDSVNSKATELSQALAGLAKKIDSKADTGISSAVGPFTALIQWFGQSYLDYKRFKTLKGAVETADPVLKDAVKVASTEAIGFGLSGANELHRRAGVHLNRVSMAPARPGVALQQEADVTEAIEQYAKATAIAKVGVVTALDAMVEAHAALLKELENPTTQRTALITAIREFYAKAKAALDAVS